MARSPVAIIPSLFLLGLSFLFLCVPFAPAQTPPPDQRQDSKPDPQLSTRDAASQQASAAAATFEQVIDRSIEREHFFIAQMKQLHPLVETYLQNLKTDKDLDVAVPASDVYFLGRLDMSSGAPDDLTFSSPGSSKLRRFVRGSARSCGIVALGNLSW